MATEIDYSYIIRELGGIAVLPKGREMEKRITWRRIAEIFRQEQYTPEEFRQDVTSSEPIAYARAQFFLSKIREALRAGGSDAALGLVIEIEGSYEVFPVDSIATI